MDKNGGSNHINSKKRIIAIIIVIAMLAAMILPLVAAVSAQEPAKIHKGIRIGGVDVSGMTREQAAAALSDTVAQEKQTVIFLTGEEEGQEVAVTAGELGMQVDLDATLAQAMSYSNAPNLIARYKAEKDLEHNGADLTPEITFDRNQVSAVVAQKCSAFNRKAVNASLRREAGNFVVEGGQTGLVVNVEESTDRILDYLNRNWGGQNARIALVMEVEEPKGSAEELMRMTDILGSFTTSYSSSGSSRCANIENACKLINGSVVYPGEEFSILATITPFTGENGYYLAGSYLGDQVVESFGGGICQVSTTLYNAIIRAELSVTARSNHSMIVGYVKPSMDAAIAESSNMDFRFVNNLHNPVYIEGYTEGKSITFNVYGVETRDPGRVVTFESETLSTTPPEGEKIYTDSSRPAGYISVTAGHTGYTARLWKVVTQGGQEVSREVFNTSNYNMTPTIATVGTDGASDALRAAISTGSIEAVKAVINGTPAPLDQTPDQQAVQAAASAAAQQAYAAALAAGDDEATAMAKAQQAANAVVNQAAAGQ